MKKQILAIISLFLLLGSASSLFAAKVSGTFEATKHCQAYTSKNKRTNPDDVRLVIGDKYDVVSVNVPEGTTWYLIDIPNIDQKQRWVYHECGKADVKVVKREKPKTPSECSTPNLEDSYVFAVSWQPAFCEKMGDSKPECKVTDPKSFQASNFTLHGLWPNKKSCGTNYGFCGEQKKVKGPFCNYPPLSMELLTWDGLEMVMPSAAAGSCLQRHEWYKHGTCQDKNTNDYYEEAIDFVKQFNSGKVKELIDNSIGESVLATEFYEAVDKTFGKDAHKRMQIICYKDMLIDIYINLPKDLSTSDKLGDLILSADEKFRNSCGDKFIIDKIGQ